MRALPTHKSRMNAVVVMPCFNEESNLQDTCASLGFGLGRNVAPENIILIIVNNNSTDSTQKIAEEIKCNSPINTVLIGLEKEQGFVPARHTGNLLAKSFADALNYPLHNVLILQADADTIYSENYINLMRAEAEMVGENFFIEACVDYPAAFKSEYQQYIGLCNKIDNKFAKLYSSKLSEDMIVDDKAVCYRLNDYFTWGGHCREYDNAGEEVYAETSRLYVKARAKGASRTPVDTAYAFHSVRKILSNPILHLATAGFPLETSWNKLWKHEHPDTIDLRSLVMQVHHPYVIEAIKVREKHLLALFCILPIHVTHTMKADQQIAVASFSDFVLPLLPQRSFQDLLSQPHIFLTDVLELVNQYEDMLGEKAYQYCL